MRRQVGLPLTLAVLTMACARGSSGEAGDTSIRDTSATTVAPQTPSVETTGAAPQAPAAPTGEGSTKAPSRPSPATPTRPSEPPPRLLGGTVFDTARGRASVVGSTPITQVVLRPASGPSITLTGPLTDEIRAASGADVWVRGRRLSERSFEVAAYAVRSVDGVPAVTGTLRVEGGRLILVSDDGRSHTIANPPATLRDLAGGRVWVSGDLSTGITAYGILRRPR
jgi:hypothetical protein